MKTFLRTSIMFSLGFILVVIPTKSMAQVNQETALLVGSDYTPSVVAKNCKPIVEIKLKTGPIDCISVTKVSKSIIKNVVNNRKSSDSGLSTINSSTFGQTSPKFSGPVSTVGGTGNLAVHSGNLAIKSGLVDDVGKVAVKSNLVDDIGKVAVKSGKWVLGIGGVIGAALGLNKNK